MIIPSWHPHCEKRKLMSDSIVAAAADPKELKNETVEGRPTAPSSPPRTWELFQKVGAPNSVGDPIPTPNFGAKTR